MSRRRPMIYRDLEAVENALAAIDAADEAARVIALRAASLEILAEADLIRQKLGWLWLQLDAERQAFRDTETPASPGANQRDAGRHES